MGLAIADLKRFHNVDESPARPSPEKLLWSTVLELALTDLESADGATKRRTRAWVTSRRRDIGSFWWVCEILGFDPQAVRHRGVARSTNEKRLETLTRSC